MGRTHGQTDGQTAPFSNTALLGRPYTYVFDAPVKNPTNITINNLVWYHMAGHWSLSAVTRARFHASVLRPASQLAQCTRPQGWELINAALLSLINEAGECMLCYHPLESTRRPRFVCRHDRVTREVGRVGIVGRDRGRRGY